MSKIIKTNIFKILLVLILFLSALLTFYKFNINPPSLDWDEVSLGYNAYSILKTGADEYGNKLPLSIRSFDDYKPPLYVYLDVPEPSRHRSVSKSFNILRFPGRVHAERRT